MNNSDNYFTEIYYARSVTTLASKSYCQQVLIKTFGLQRAVPSTYFHSVPYWDPVYCQQIHILSNTMASTKNFLLKKYHKLHVEKTEFKILSLFQEKIWCGSNL